MRYLAKVKKFFCNHAKNDYFDEKMRLRPIVQKRCGIMIQKTISELNNTLPSVVRNS